VSDRPPTEDDLRCIEVVELATPYLDSALDEEERSRIDAHLAGCAGCRAAMDQFGTVKRLSGRLTPADVADLDPFVRDRLLSTLRAPRRK
jgi:predicted anti-sigma-YlaC factor YlaD